MVGSFNAWYEVCVRDFIRQKAKAIIGDRAAAYCPEDSYVIPPDNRMQKLIVSSLEPEPMKLLRMRCRSEGILFKTLQIEYSFISFYIFFVPSSVFSWL